MEVSKIRNIAIIAHVDHGKTTLVDKLLHAGHLFKDHENPGELIMDSNDLERERGITILAKNVSVRYKDYKINVIALYHPKSPLTNGFPKSFCQFPTSKT